MAKLKGKEPKCEDCMPKLEIENQIPFQLFMLLRHQNIMTEGMPIALNLQTARAEINRVIKKETDQDIVLNRILIAHQKMIQTIHEDRRDKFSK